MSNEDFTTGPGFLAIARKAVVAGVGSFAASFGPALAVAGADGVITFAGEIVPIGVVALTLAAAAALAVYATPNATGGAVSADPHTGVFRNPGAHNE